KGVAGGSVETRLAPAASRTLSELSDSITLARDGVAVNSKKLIPLGEEVASTAGAEFGKTAKFEAQDLRNLLHDATIELPIESLKPNAVHLFNEAKILGEPIDKAAEGFNSSNYRKPASGFFDVGVHGEGGKAYFKLGKDLWCRLSFE